MSLIGFDSANRYAAGSSATAGFNGILAAFHASLECNRTAGRNGVPAFFLTSATVDAAWNLLSTVNVGSTIFFGVHGRAVSSFTNAADIARLYNGTTMRGGLQINSDGTLSWFSATGTVRATSALTINVGEDYFFEGEIGLATDATGHIKIWVDGVLFIDVATVITVSGTGINRFGIQGWGGDAYCECWYACDAVDVGDNCNGNLGNVRCQYRAPDTDTAQADFTPSTGADNYAMVDDDGPDEDTTYNASDTLGHKDMFEQPNAFAGSTFFGVNLHIRARKEASGVMGIKGVIESNGTEAKTALAVPTTSFASTHKQFSLNPDDSAPWDAADLNALLLGYELTTSA